MENQNPQSLPTQQPEPVVSHPPSSGPSKTFLFALVFVLLVAVGAGAYFLGVKNTQPVSQPVATPSIVAKPTPAIDPTASWKVYTNKKYGYTIKYPSTWETYAYGKQPQDDPVDTVAERFFRPIGDKGAEISLEISLGNSAALSVLANDIKAYSWENKTVSTPQIAGTNATEVSGMLKGKQNLVVVFANGNDIYKLQTLGDYAEILHQILSTFIFTPASQQ